MRRSTCPTRRSSSTHEANRVSTPDHAAARRMEACRRPRPVGRGVLRGCRTALPSEASRRSHRGERISVEATLSFHEAPVLPEEAAVVPDEEDRSSPERCQLSPTKAMVSPPDEAPSPPLPGDGLVKDALRRSPSRKVSSPHARSPPGEGIVIPREGAGDPHRGAVSSPHGGPSPMRDGRSRCEGDRRGVPRWRSAHRAKRSLLPGVSNGA